MIIDKEKLIFIHIPKNAGSSIKKYLIGKDEYNKFKRPWDHKTINDIKNEDFDKYKSYKKFAIVRNPYDRVVSWFAYLKKYRLDNDLLNTYQYDSKTNSYKIIETVKAPVEEFKNWILDPYSDFNKTTIILDLLKSQHEWIDESVIILKYENLNNELSDFFNKKIKLPKINNTSRFNVINYYDKKSLDIVYNRYKQDFKKFNYKKL
tara:strand:+ start:279 stop:896 length:618 start_codon:yes stop_codon:yes gene_type:complete